MMAKEVRLPQLGQTMEEGTIVNCLIQVDDEVKKGDVIFEIETDKATLEMESPADGFVKHIIAAGRSAFIGTRRQGRRRAAEFCRFARGR
ncbi:MAG: biotin/lipoyl-containing protein [Planctomycetota bacterium]